MLTIPRAIIAAGIIIAGGLVIGLSNPSGDIKTHANNAGGFISPALAQTAPNPYPGPFMIAGGGAQLVWRIDQSTGAVSYCVRDTASVSRRAIRDDDLAPYCSAWTNPAGANLEE
jgi:hypothetical protein